MYSTEYSEKESVSDWRSVDSFRICTAQKSRIAVKKTRRNTREKTTENTVPTTKNNLRYDDWDFGKLFCSSEAGDCSLDTGSADGHDQNLQWKHKLKDTKPMHQ